MKTYVITIVLFSVFTIGTVKSHDVQELSSCESYNQATCTAKNKQDCISLEQCKFTGPETRTHCFTLWEYNTKTGTTNVQMKGCFFNNKDCYEKSHCVQRNKDEANRLYFCCCNGDMCNKNFTYTILLEQENNLVVDTKALRDTELFILTLVLTMFALGIVLTCILWYSQHRKIGYENKIIETEKGLYHPKPFKKYQQATNGAPADHGENTGVWPELLEQKALGRFGAVWTARHKNDEMVAVKVFPLRDRQSWLTEVEVFRLPGMDHEAVLHFIDAYQRGVCIDSEFWLVTAYHEKGSLCDYLKANIVSWEEMYKIALSIARGLKHLHQELVPKQDENEYKPALAHRDFKSKNVLLRADMSACIADFGLALIFWPNCVWGEHRGRVGTLRYMAPEVLDGAINFTKEGFLAIDMYACGLVLWELASRCSIKEAAVADYQLPFEKELGLKPNFEEMHICAVQQKRRPYIPDTWRTHKGLSLICDTIEECWDHDAEARISSSCVLDRLDALNKESQRT